MPVQLSLTLAERERLARRFWAKILILGADDCWPWQASVNGKGYGHIGIKGHCMKAQRVAFYLATGENAGDHTMHRCDNPPCCNPAHLESGDAIKNNQDRDTKGRGRVADKQRRAHGVVHGRAKLNESQVINIRALLKQEHTRRWIANQFGVHHTAINKIAKGRSWQHI